MAYQRQRACDESVDGKEMERLNLIWTHPLYQENMQEILKLEQNRIFCGHGPEHLLDVARLAWMMNLEQKLGYEKAVVYAAALIHDIGRAMEYQSGLSHEEGSRRLGLKILPECGYDEGEQELILEAVASHRKETETQNLNWLLYRADKLSRLCFACPAEALCDWPAEKKNMEIKG